MNGTMKHQGLRGINAAAKLAALFAGLVFASAALAHVFPQKQEPGAGATVASPAQVRVIFDGPLEPAFSSLTVTDASGKQVNTEKATVDEHQPALIAVPLPPLAAGHYTVHWVAVASDGHRTHGDYAFNVK
ncbi:copper resistance CopC family protein [Paraburkholderia aromaticivorans]|uniref:copper resistance CopC family protein n=1 Tax=Paraburkholderia aromaticivorans TaxID=2026199 RepID=UPI001455E709|nr:copper resistance protein CopC [Paraburkholderia aromaticivorans]